MGETTGVNWLVDLAVLEDGPCASRIIEIESSLPLHILVRYGPEPHENTTYKRVMVGNYPSRNDDGHIVYRVSENQ